MTAWNSSGVGDSGVFFEPGVSYVCGGWNSSSDGTWTWEDLNLHFTLRAVEIESKRESDVIQVHR